MPLSYPLLTPIYRGRWIGGLLLALVGAMLVACGGGGGSNGPDAPDGGGDGSSPTASLADLEGDWVQKGCVRAGVQSYKRTLRARITAPHTLDYYEGVLTFVGNECAGAYQINGPSKTGTLTFARSEANPTLAAHWGELRTVIGTRAGAIWTVQPASVLCLLGDEIPTIQPTLSAVASSVATIPVDTCYVR